MTDNGSTVGTFGLGTWAWGDSGRSGDGYFGSELSQATLEEVADKAHAAGFTLWDTALVYGMGRSEQLLGDVLQRYDRDAYRLSTKFTPQIAGDGENPVADMLEQSLASLRTDHVDLYWIHNPADIRRWTPQLIPLLESGRVRHIGVSNHNLAEIQLADQILGDAGFRVEAVQNHYSLLYRSSEEAGILDYCRRSDIRFFGYMVLEQGALTGRYSTRNPLPEGSARAESYNALLPQLEALSERLAALGKAREASEADIATAWALGKGVTPIIGVTKPEHIDGLARAAGITLTTDEVTELETLAAAANVNTRGSWEHEM